LKGGHGIIKKKVDATIAFLWENFSAFCFDDLNSIILKPGAPNGYSKGEFREFNKWLRKLKGGPENFKRASQQFRGWSREFKLCYES